MLQQELHDAVVVLLQVGDVAVVLKPIVDDHDADVVVAVAAAVVVVGSVDITEDMAVVLSHLRRRLKADDGLFHFLNGRRNRNRIGTHPEVRRVDPCQMPA